MIFMKRWIRVRERYSFYEIYEIILRRMGEFLPELLSLVMNRILFLIKRVQCGSSFASRGVILIRNGSRLPFTGPVNIRIGKGVTINSSRKADAIGGDTKTILRTITSRGHIEIGDYTGISNSAIVAKESVLIGSYVKIGAGCKIYDNDFHSLNAGDRAEENRDVKSGAIIIGDNVFIGAHTIILKGVTIGENAIVGAGAVVTRSIPAGEVWAGNPARCIKC